MQNCVFFHKNNHHSFCDAEKTYKKAIRLNCNIFSYTFAFDADEILYLLNFEGTLHTYLKNQKPIPIPVGVAVCHPADMYSKAKGREVALQKAKTEDFYVYSICADRNTENQELKLEVVLKNNKITLEVTRTGNQIRYEFMYDR